MGYHKDAQDTTVDASGDAVPPSNSDSLSTQTHLTTIIDDHNIDTEAQHIKRASVHAYSTSSSSSSSSSSVDFEDPNSVEKTSEKADVAGLPDNAALALHTDTVEDTSRRRRMVRSEVYEELVSIRQEVCQREAKVEKWMADVEELLREHEETKEQYARSLQRYTERLERLDVRIEEAERLSEATDDILAKYNIQKVTTASP